MPAIGVADMLYSRARVFLFSLVAGSPISNLQIGRSLRIKVGDKVKHDKIKGKGIRSPRSNRSEQGKAKNMKVRVVVRSHQSTRPYLHPFQRRIERSSLSTEIQIAFPVPHMMICLVLKQQKSRTKITKQSCASSPQH